MVESEYAHLNLRGWPFHVTAGVTAGEVWVGRPDLQRKMQNLVRSASRHPASRIVLLWATFGSGKTHALRYIAHVASTHDDLVPVYVTTPEGIRSFLDIYRAIVDALLKDGLLNDAGTRLFKHRPGGGRSDVERALLRIATLGEGGANIAGAWLRAERVPIRELREVGLNSRVETVADAVDALNELIEALRLDGTRSVMLLIDEVQVLEGLGKRLGECIGGLHKVFDRNTEGLTLVLSFTTGTLATVRAILGEILIDRSSRTYTLPPLTTLEGVQFIEDLLREWSIDESAAPAPFTQEAIREVVAELAGPDVTLTPRALIKAFDSILREAEPDIEDQTLAVIDTAIAREYLATDGQT
jgi:hypothetical protein